MTITLRDLMEKPRYVMPGNAACPGCGALIALKIVSKVLGDDAVYVIPACCTSVIQGPYPKSGLRIPIFNVAFMAAASTAAGMAAGLAALGKRGLAVVWAGDGGTYDIGIQALSGAAERGDDVLYICYNNEAYMNTGIQRSGATPPRAWTKTTPRGKAEMKKNMPIIVAAHGASYVATASVSHPIDLARKVKKARDMKRFRYIEVLTPCPTGWNFPVDKTVEVAKLAVETLVWPLFEIEGGILKINYKPREKRPLSEYLRLQRRFAHLTDEDVALLESMFEERWRALLELEGKKVFV